MYNYLNKEVFIWGLLGLQSGRYRFKKYLNCVPLDYKMGEAKTANPQLVTRIVYQEL